MITEIAFLAIGILLLVVIPIAFTYGCWRFWYDARWWLIVGATGAHTSTFRLIRLDADGWTFWLHVASVILGLAIAYKSWRELTHIHPQPARRAALTNLAKLYGIKRRWRGLEPDFLLRPRIIVELNRRRT